jgi:nucleotide-binding universal stress UspA family protein
LTHVDFEPANDRRSTEGRRPGRNRGATQAHAPILAAVTFDDAGRQCLRGACRRAGKTGQPVIALHVVHETGRTTGLYRQHDRGITARPLVDVAKRLLADFSAEIIADEVDCAPKLQELAVVGLPETRIPEVARLTGAGLILLGCRRKHGLERLLGRSVCRAVLQHAPCAVALLGADGNSLDPAELFPDLERRPFPPAMDAG